MQLPQQSCCSNTQASTFRQPASAPAQHMNETTQQQQQQGDTQPVSTGTPQQQPQQQQQSTVSPAHASRPGKLTQQVGSSGSKGPAKAASTGAAATAGARSPAQQQQLMRPKPPQAASKTGPTPHKPAAAAVPHRQGAAVTAAVSGRVGGVAKVPAGPARAAATAIRAAAPSSLAPSGPKAAAAGPITSEAATAAPTDAAGSPPTPPKAAAAATAGAGGAGGRGGCNPSATCAGVVDALLSAAPGLLSMQDADGFTPLMRLVQAGRGADALCLLARGDCGIGAQASSTGDTALHLAVYAGLAGPDHLRLVSALVAAGADPSQPRAVDGSTPLMLAVKAGGATGLALATALLSNRPAINSNSVIGQRPTNQEQQPEDGPDTEQATSSLWCPLDPDSANPPSSSSSVVAVPAVSSAAGAGSSSSRSGLNTRNAVGETAVSLAAAAVLRPFSSAQAPASTAAAAAQEAQPADAQQQLLELLLSRGAELPQQQATELLQLGLTGKLSDSLTAQVVTSLPSMSALKAAAAAGTTAAPGATLKTPDLSFQGLLDARLYRTVVAWLCKDSGKRPAEIVDAAGNSLLHTAVLGPDDLPGYVSALVEAGVAVNAANADHDSALHVAARQGHLQACQALVAAGADLLRRNGKNRIPGSQLKLAEPIYVYLQEAEEAFRAAKDEQRRSLWDDKMRATQTASAFGIRVT